MNRILIALSVCTVVVLGGLDAADAQQGEPAATNERRGDVVYEREVFRYERAGRRDPFRSLLGAAELAVRVDDLRVVGVVHDPAGESVVVLRESGTDRRFRVREGDRIGGIRVQRIHPDRVDLLVEEFGVTRRESLEIRRRN